MTIQHGQGLRKINRNLYENIHQWLRKNFTKTGVCEKCGHRKKTEFALKKGEYYKKSRAVFIELCISCHKKYDETEERKNKISQAHRGRENYWKWVPIVAIDENDVQYEFRSLLEASKKLNIIRTAISNCLIRRAKTAGGYKFYYGY